MVFDPLSIVVAIAAALAVILLLLGSAWAASPILAEPVTPPTDVSLFLSERTLSRIATEELQKPVLVDFGAEWCHPCKQLDPIVEELAEEWDGRVKVCKLDIDANLNTTMSLGIMGVPTLILFIDGEPVEQI